MKNDLDQFEVMRRIENNPEASTIKWQRNLDLV